MTSPNPESDNRPNDPGSGGETLVPGGLDRVGLWVSSFGGYTVSETRDIAAELDAQGWESLWFGEAFGREAFTQARILLESTSRMRIGTGIANIWARDAAASASAARTNEAMYPGRFVLGLGVSHAPLVQRRDHEYAKPLAAMRRYVEALVGTHPESKGEEDLPDVVLAALGPKMLELSGTAVSGAHPYLTTPEHTARAREILGGDATGSGPLLVVEQGAVLTPSAVRGNDVWRQRAHDHLEIYTGLPNYRNSWKRLGFDESDFVRGGSDRLKEALVPCGVEETAAAVRAHLEAGASHVVVQVLGPSVLEAPREDWAVLAEALR